MTNSNNSGNSNTNNQPVIITIPNNAANGSTTISNGGQIILPIPTAGGSITTYGGQWFTYNGATQTWTTSSGPADDSAPSAENDQKDHVEVGCVCKKCKEFYEFASPNQDDGTLICWACRNGY